MLAQLLSIFPYNKFSHLLFISNYHHHHLNLKGESNLSLVKQVERICTVEINHKRTACHHSWNVPCFDKQMTWPEARAFCKAIGGDLMSLSSDLNIFSTILQHLSTHRQYIMVINSCTDMIRFLTFHDHFLFSNYSVEYKYKLSTNYVTCVPSGCTLGYTQTEIAPTPLLHTAYDHSPLFITLPPSQQIFFLVLATLSL